MILINVLWKLFRLGYCLQANKLLVNFFNALYYVCLFIILFLRVLEKVQLKYFCICVLVVFGEVALTDEVLTNKGGYNYPPHSL